MKKASWIILPLIVLVLVGCLKDFEKIEINGIQPTLAVPLIDSRLGVYHILAREDSTDLVEVNSEGEIALSYNTTLPGPTPSSIFSMPDFSISESFEFTHPGGNTTIDTTFTQSDLISQSFSAGTVLLKSSDLKSGNFTLNINSSFDNMHFELGFPGIITSDGLPISIDLDLNAGQTSVPIDLSNAEINLNPIGEEYNTIRANYSITIDYNKQYATATDEFVQFEMDFSDLEFQKVIGNFGGTELFGISDSILIKLFKSSMQGVLQLLDPRINIRTENSLGIPISLQFNTLSTKDEETQESDSINFDNIGNEFLIPFPQVDGAQTEGLLSINKDNSNISDILVPKNQTFFVDAALVVDSASSSMDDFINLDAGMDINVDLDMPLAGFAHSWVLTDTMPFSLSLEQELLTALNFKMIIDNGFPVGSTLQIYFLDENKNVLDSLIDEDSQFIVPAQTDANGKVNQSSVVVNTVSLPKERGENVFKSSYIAIEAEVETFNGKQEQIIRFYDDYFLDVKVGFLAQFQIEI